MGLTLKHIVLARAGTFHYRRRIPKDAAVVIGRGEFKRLLGQTEREALRNFPRVNAEYERMVFEARSCEEAQNRPLINVIRENSISADTSYEAGPSTIEPVVNIHRVSQPSPTLAEAKRLYLRERIKGDINEKQKTLRLERIMGYVSHGIELDRPLTHLNREDAREVRDHMLRDLEMNPSTVRRYMNDIRAVIGFGITEFGLRGALNPFQRLEIRVQTVASEERSPIPDKTLKSIRARLEGHAGDDLWQIWRILEGTGCRLGEITGLLVSDLHLDNAIPYLNLVHHAHRRLKNNGSVRRVPLLGEALEAAKEAVRAAGKSHVLFPRYGRNRGADGASASLMKHVRTVTDDPKIVVHSLRHTMEDRLIRARVDEFDRNLVLGHSKGGMGERYGGPDARLEVAAEAVKAALA